MTWRGMKHPRNKYGAKRTPYNGRIYHSKAEADYAAKLDLLKKARGDDRVIEWLPQVKIPLSVDGILIGHYVVDFYVQYADRQEYQEIKAFDEKRQVWITDTDLWKWKKKHFEAQYPNAILKVIKP